MRASQLLKVQEGESMLASSSILSPSVPQFSIMPFIQSPQDGATLFYTHHRPASALVFRPDEVRINNNKNRAIFFIHGWPMSSRMYQHLYLPLSQTYGIQCIAPDRRGFGRSEWSGPRDVPIQFETFAEDTVAIIKSIPELTSLTLVCASMGCGESILVYELLKAEGLEKLVKNMIWLGPSLPHPVQTEQNPEAPSRETWNMILDGLRGDRAAFVQASVPGIFALQHGVEMTVEAVDFYCKIIHEADSIAIERCCQILSNYDFTEKIKTLSTSVGRDLSLTTLHGDKDQGQCRQSSRFC